MKTMIYKVVSFFTPEDKKEIRIGDYYYKDGTLSHEYTKEKECIGVVFSLNVATEEKEQYPHGYVVALSDVTISGNSLYLWYNREKGEDKRTLQCSNMDLITKLLVEDRGGYFYSKSIFENEDKYEAVHAARNYPVELPENRTSGWYLPSSGQMYEIAHRFIKKIGYEEQPDLLDLSEKYMVSQLKDEICPLYINMRNFKFGYDKPEHPFSIRSIFSF